MRRLIHWECNFQLSEWDNMENIVRRALVGRWIHKRHTRTEQIRMNETDVQSI